MASEKPSMASITRAQGPSFTKFANIPTMKGPFYITVSFIEYLNRYSKDLQRQFAARRPPWKGFLRSGPQPGVYWKPKRPTHESQCPRDELPSPPSNSPLESLPLELLENIAEALPTARDKVYLASTSKALRVQLGRDNNRFWHRALSKVVKYKKYNSEIDYHAKVLDFLAGKEKGCYRCLSRVSTCDLLIDDKQYKTVCSACRYIDFRDYIEIVNKYPEMQFPDNLKAVCHHKREVHVPLIHIDVVRRIIKEQNILRNERLVTQPDFRFLAHWNKAVSHIHNLGTANVLLIHRLLEHYETEPYEKYHVIKSPEEFRKFMEAVVLAPLMQPAGPFIYPTELYQLVHISANFIAHSSSESTVTELADAQAARLIAVLLDEGSTTASIFDPPNLQRAFLLPIWIREYIADNSHKMFRERKYKGKSSRCCFCVAGQFDRILEDDVSENVLNRWNATSQDHTTTLLELGKIMSYDDPFRPTSNNMEPPPLSVQINPSMTSVNLSPPSFRRPSRNTPSPKTRAARQAAIRYNTRVTDLDKIHTRVQDFAFQAGLELQTAIKHPGHATKRLSGALASTVAKSTEIGESLASVGEAGGRMGFEQLARGYGQVAKRAKRAARRASIAISGQPKQDGGMGEYGSDDDFEEFIDERDTDEDCGLMDWPIGIKDHH
ncbi:hypothetical protein TWF696_004730 [Orbilia brochopaga]|uniref:F-box domain-containing protein n=1 Tax=Orbilia brochopaga TaxID=3140254 RepID=A0AAV9V1C4_9PEZI